MKYALITTFEAEQPYCFREVLEQRIEGDFEGVIWVELPDGSPISPRTHKYTSEGFVEIPPPSPDKDTRRPSPRPIDPDTLTNTDQPVVM